jgi:hypothetical protein
MNSNDGKGTLSMLSFEADKIRLLRSLIIETETMQVSFFKLSSVIYIYILAGSLVIAGNVSWSCTCYAGFGLYCLSKS